MTVMAMKTAVEFIQRCYFYGLVFYFVSKLWYYYARLAMPRKPAATPS